MASDPIDKLRRTAYPNPERHGCPDSAVFQAIRRRELELEDPIWTHIEHCSPCYCQFVEIRDVQFRQERQSDFRSVALRSLIIFILLTFGVSLYFFRHKQNIDLRALASNRGEAAVLNFEDGSELRGVHSNSVGATDNRIQHLPRNRLTLTVYLPLGSPSGTYELEVVSPTDALIWHAQGEASIKNGLTSIPVDSDMSNVSPGKYQFRFRLSNDTWREKDIIVQ